MTDQNIPAEKKLFFSDVHLGGFDEAENRKLEQELIHLIDYCENNGFEIYILGDLFDYWMEYPGHKPDLGKALLQRFEAFNAQNRSTLYITGNHDNWTNGYFKSIGFEVEKNHRLLSINGRKVMILHGDGLKDPSFELPRPLFHRLLRNRKFVKVYQTLLPPQTGLEVMKRFSRLARAREVSEPEKNLNNWAENELKRTDTDIILSGHDHTPRILNFDFGTFINLGTFYQHRTVAMYNNDQFSLVTWDHATGQLKSSYPHT